MARHFKLTLALGVVLAGATLLPATSATAATRYRVSVTLPATLSSNLPLLRLHFSAPTKASALPALATKPALRTKWQQIGPNDVQAVLTSTLTPATTYTISTPIVMTCTKKCRFSATRPRVASALTNLTWEAQLLAELHYVPLRFAPSTTSSDPSQQVNGTFTWAYPNLPTTLSAQWRLGTDNVILHSALMAFQSQSNLTVTGEVDATTWSHLLAAALAKKVDPAPYNYVDVSMALPETLTLYIAGHAKDHFIVNTGIAVSPTATGTYPVYERFLTTTMSGTNPDGSHYSDSGIPDVSYFNGGDALHGFIRSTYGWPQSLGCVEMPFASAAAVFPHTPIGTLVTVRA
ncbi:MAG TPA: L,D-transpeptidase family protein [Acidimicrobiales bacterium]|nr:L,D-transpeptidase family protein [Acidimicrobiales bacterium]